LGEQNLRDANERALEELSSFTCLSSLMKIHATVAVTSCSAERTMSRVKIIKNRLRSTMLDDRTADLTVGQFKEECAKNPQH